MKMMVPNRRLWSRIINLKPLAFGSARLAGPLVFPNVPKAFHRWQSPSTLQDYCFFKLCTKA